jgi:hypothetical protein
MFVRITIILILLFPQWAYAAANFFNAQNWHYQGFENETINTIAECIAADTGNDPVSDCFDQGSAGGLDWGPADQDCYSVVSTTYTAREGSKHLTLGCRWPGDGDYDYKWIRSYLYAEGTDLNQNNRLTYDDGTEYWLGWSQYVPSGYADQTRGSGIWQGFGGLWGGGSCTPDSWVHIIGNYGGDSDCGGYCSDGDKMTYDSRPGSDTTDSVTWQSHKGYWIDWMIQMRLYDSAVAGSRFRIYKNGVLWAGSANDDTATLHQTDCTLVINWMDYNAWGDRCSDWGGEPPTTLIDCTGCSAGYFEEDSPYDCDTAGWTRETIIDSIRFVKYASGQASDTNYDDVAPAIYPAKTDVTSPADQAADVDIDLDVTVTTSAYTEQANPADPLGIFSHRQTDWRLCADSECNTVITSSLNDTSNLVSWTIDKSNFATATTYYVEVTHESWAGDIDRDGDGTTAASDSDDVYPCPDPEISSFTTEGAPVGGAGSLYILQDTGTGQIEISPTPP